MDSFKENDLLIYYTEDPRTAFNQEYLYDLITHNSYVIRFRINRDNNISNLFVNFNNGSSFKLYTDIFRETGLPVEIFREL